MGYQIKKFDSGESLYINGNKKIKIPKDSAVKEYPILSHYNNVTNYFGIVLDIGIAIKPHTIISIFVDLPADTGIYVYSGNYYTIIDKIENFKKQFSLYGTASDGMIYRYFKTKYTKKISGAHKNKIPTNINIDNNSNTWQIVNKIIFEAESLNLFSNGKKVIGERIFINISDKEFVTIKLNNEPSEKGFKIMHHSLLQKKKGIKSNVVEMRYGI